MEDYKIIYNLKNEIIEFEVYIFFAVLLILGTGVFFYYFKKASGMRRIEGIYNGLILAVLSICILSWQGTKDIKEHFRVREVYSNNNFQFIEGIVENHASSPDKEHSKNFIVNNTKFDYSHCQLGCNGFNNLGETGALIKENLKTRISYINVKGQNVILKLEVQVQ